MSRRKGGPRPLVRGTLLAAGAAALATSMPSSAASQGMPDGPAAPTDPPAIQALVLSTGASRGFAHVGALVALDSLGYDPDLVVGTSMGAVVGALYAAGYDPVEIASMIRAVDWGDVFMPAQLVLGPERRVLAPSLGLGINLAAFEVSRGFVSDARVNRLMVRLLFAPGAAAKSDFDRLPRRYRAVVADFSTGEEVVIGDGDLARAARISMGAPAFFAPLQRDGRLLTDGGVANYLPISVARALGATEVIAVDVSRPHPRIEDRHPAALAGRALGLLMRNAAPDTLADVLIVPDIDPDFSGAIFPDDPEPLVRLGFDATLAEAPRARGEPKPRRLGRLPDSLRALRLEVPDKDLEVMVRRAFAELAPGPFDAERVLARVDRLYATGLVTGVWPRVEEGDVLVVAAEAVPRTSLWVAPGYDNDRGGRLWVALQQRIRGGGLPAEVGLAASMSGVERWGEAALRGYDPSRPLAAVLSLYGRQTGVRVHEPDSLAGEVNVWRAGAWLGGELRRAFPDRLVTLGVHGEHVHVVDGPRGMSFGPSLRIAATGAPGLVIGVPMELEAELRFGRIAYGAAGVRGSLPFRLPGLVAAAVAEGDVTWGDPPLDARPALGDGHVMPGLASGAERGDARLVGGLDVGRPLMLGGFLRARLRAGAAPDAVDDLSHPGTWVAGAALEGVWTLPFGPIVVGGGLNTRGHHRLHVSLGAVF